MAAEVAKSTGRRMQVTPELLQQLAVTIAANEKAQRRFRTAIVLQVAKIDTTVKMIYGAQIAEAHGGVGPTNISLQRNGCLLGQRRGRERGRLLCGAWSRPAHASNAFWRQIILRK